MNPNDNAMMRYAPKFSSGQTSVTPGILGLMDVVRAGTIVRYADPQSDAERIARFVVIEDRGPTVLAQDLDLIKNTSIGATYERSKPDMVSCADEELGHILMRHFSGDWGDLGQEDKYLNDVAVFNGERIVSMYRTGCFGKVYVITYQGHYTTVMLAEEY